MSSLIELQKITKVYQTGSISISALSQVDLQINRHEMVAIIGTSGSGKSTMMNILGLLDRPTTGTFLFNGYDTATFNDNELAEFRNRRVGFVFQSFFLLPRLNAEQNVALPLMYRDINPAEAIKIAFAKLKEINISHLYRNRPNQMSGGEQQRVAIARALVGDPDIILADEPTGALDSKTSQDIMNLFVKLNVIDKKTVILITHDIKIAEQCRRIVRLKDGRIIEDMQNPKFNPRVAYEG